MRPAVGLGEPATFLTGTWLGGSSLDRGLSLARRLEKAAFTSPSRLEIELRDRFDERRRWRAALELRQSTWVLTEVRIVRTTPALSAARATRS